MKIKIPRSEFSQDNQLFPEHLADLRKSGLLDPCIRESGVFSIRGDDLEFFLGKSYTSVKSALAFPYGAGFYRFKLFPPISFRKDGELKLIRYLQKTGTAPRLFIPQTAEKILHDPAQHIYITEGEKKAMAACQQGIPCIAVGGLWNWLYEGKPIDDFDRILWKDRRVTLIGDADVWLPRKSDLRKAIYALGREIVSRGARVSLVVLPTEVEL